GVDNLLDKDYSEHLNLAGNSSFGYSANTSVNEPGRTFWGKINVTFGPVPVRKGRVVYSENMRKLLC
ncbi:hypothetical protein Q2428_23890, partial [Escherichia coli]|nr:hypothetical protein [Escherichia coli]